VAGTSYYLVIQYYNVPVRAGTADIILEPAAPAQDAPVEVPPVAPAPPEVRGEPVAAPEGVETTAPTGSGGSQSGQ
jgi:hypothetical protein